MSSEATAPGGAAGETASERTSPVEGEEERESGETPEEPETGSLSPAARAAALAESGVLEGDADERDAEERDEEGPVGDDNDADAVAEGREHPRGGGEAGRDGGRSLPSAPFPG